MPLGAVGLQRSAHLASIGDRDPFLLFELRGRTKEQVLSALRAARGGASESTAKKRSKAKAARPIEDQEVLAVKLGKVKAADYDKPREAMPTLHFGFEEPLAHGAVLDQLGAPAAWEGDSSPTMAGRAILLFSSENFSHGEH